VGPCEERFSSWRNNTTTAFVLLFPIVGLRARHGDGELRHRVGTVKVIQGNQLLSYCPIVIRRITWLRQVARSRVCSRFFRTRLQIKSSDTLIIYCREITYYICLEINFTRGTLIATPGEPDRGWSSTPLLFSYHHKGKRDNGYMSGASQCVRLCWGLLYVIGDSKRVPMRALYCVAFGNELFHHD
jgi:hypothetical protein